MKIEICANSFESAKAAQEGGANRIELCANLSMGGVTPNKESIQKVIKELDIAVHVLIRPRGGDFVYSQKEIFQMKDTIAFCKTIGCAGIVSGALTAQHDIDKDVTEELINASEGIEFTFHRAFDVCREPLQALEDLKQLGVTRLLSSGQHAKAADGIELLKKLKVLSEGEIQIMPGSGVNNENAIAFKDAKFEAIHFSAIKKSKEVSVSSFFDTGVEGTSDLHLIKKMVKLLA